MVPFASRIRDGRFSFAGERVSLAANNLPEPHAIHGHGFQRPWQQLAATETSLLLEYLHPADSWPWMYRARQHVALQEESLVIRLTVANLSGRPMPLGIGLHPYFVSTPACRVLASVASQWRLDEELLPISAAAGRRDDASSVLFRSGEQRDALYSGWDGTAILELPERQARIRIQAGPPLNHLVVFADAAAQAVCIEPVSNVVDAFNLSGDADPGDLYQVLQPDQQIIAEVSITPECY